MNSHDQLSGFFWMAISIVVVCMSIQSGMGTFHEPGPGFLPFWSGVILGVLAMILVVTSSLRKREGTRIRSLWAGRQWRNFILVILSLFIYATLLPRIGYLITTFGLMVLWYGLIGRRRLWIQGAGALITALVTYLIFCVWLKIQLPKGIFGF